MHKFTRIGFIVAACLSGTWWAFAQVVPSSSQPTPSEPLFAQMDPQDGGEAPSMRGHHMNPKDRMAFFEAHVAALHAGLQLSPEQEKLWPPLESALRAISKQVREFRDQHKVRPAPGDFIAHLKMTSERAAFRAQMLQNFTDALAPLYAQLGEDQKARLIILLHSFRDLAINNHRMHYFADPMGEGGSKSMMMRRSNRVPMDDNRP